MDHSIIRLLKGRRIFIIKNNNQLFSYLAKRWNPSRDNLTEFRVKDYIQKVLVDTLEPGVEKWQYFCIYRAQWKFCIYNNIIVAWSTERNCDLSFFVKTLEISYKNLHCFIVYKNFFYKINIPFIKGIYLFWCVVISLNFFTKYFRSPNLLKTQLYSLKRGDRIDLSCFS